MQGRALPGRAPERPRCKREGLGHPEPAPAWDSPCRSLPKDKAVAARGPQPAGGSAAGLGGAPFPDSSLLCVSNIDHIH